MDKHMFQPIFKDNPKLKKSTFLFQQDNDPKLSCPKIARHSKLLHNLQTPILLSTLGICWNIVKEVP